LAAATATAASSARTTPLWTAAVGWALDRLGVLDNPLGAVEDAFVDHPWWVVVGLAVVAVGCWLGDRSGRPLHLDRRGHLRDQAAG
jgi:hypothetical protein